MRWDTIPRVEFFPVNPYATFRKGAHLDPFFKEAPSPHTREKKGAGTLKSKQNKEVNQKERRQKREGGHTKKRSKTRVFLPFLRWHGQDFHSCYRTPEGFQRGFWRGLWRGQPKDPSKPLLTPSRTFRKPFKKVSKSMDGVATQKKENISPEKWHAKIDQFL